MAFKNYLFNLKNFMEKSIDKHFKNVFDSMVLYQLGTELLIFRGAISRCLITEALGLSILPD